MRSSRHPNPFPLRAARENAVRCEEGAPQVEIGTRAVCSLAEMPGSCGFQFFTSRDVFEEVRPQLRVLHQIVIVWFPAHSRTGRSTSQGPLNSTTLAVTRPGQIGSAFLPRTSMGRALACAFSSIEVRIRAWFAGNAWSIGCFRSSGIVGSPSESSASLWRSP